MDPGDERAHMPHDDGCDGARKRWQSDQTTFQRIYDVVVGTHEFRTVQAFADHAACSENGARQALKQLSEMGIARERDGRPAAYRRNDSYFTWKRVESLAHKYDPDELRARVDDLIEEDQAFQERYRVPEPDAVATDDLPVDDHDSLHERWEDLAEWRTVRRDVRVLRQAVQRAEGRLDGGAVA